MILNKLYEKKLISPPKWLLTNTVYLCYMGSQAYGVNTNDSDCDLYGIAIPPKDEIFPHLRGEIVGFGRQKKRFEQWQASHIEDKEDRQEYDATVYNITKFFMLAMENNPNIVDSLFVPLNCIAYSNQIGQLIRENRHIFLHKGAFHKFKGYAYSQLYKMSTNKSESSNRQEIVAKYGFGIKFGYHLFRLASEIEQILTTGDLDLQKNNKQMLSIRRGEWSEDKLKSWFSEQEKYLDSLYISSDLRHSPDEDKIRNLLLRCLEIHYGNLDGCVKKDINIPKIINEIEEKLQELRTAI